MGGVREKGSERAAVVCACELGGTSEFRVRSCAFVLACLLACVAQNNECLYSV